jgi:hypothetical protein
MATVFLVKQTAPAAFHLIFSPLTMNVSPLLLHVTIPMDMSSYLMALVLLVTKPARLAQMWIPTTVWLVSLTEISTLRPALVMSLVIWTMVMFWLTVNVCLVMLLVNIVMVLPIWIVLTALTVLPCLLVSVCLLVTLTMDSFWREVYAYLVTNHAWPARILQMLTVLLAQTASFCKLELVSFPQSSVTKTATFGLMNNVFLVTYHVKIAMVLATKIVLNVSVHKSSFQALALTNLLIVILTMAKFWSMMSATTALWLVWLVQVLKTLIALTVLMVLSKKVDIVWFLATKNMDSTKTMVPVCLATKIARLVMVQVPLIVTLALMVTSKM